jgi:hypothetical protein
MSWLDDLGSMAGSAFRSIASSGFGSTLASTAVLGLILNQTNKSMNKQNSTPPVANTPQPDRFVREQMSPDTNNGVPIIYGTGFVKGKIIDAVLSNDNKTMWYAVVVCEKTGTKLSDSQDSVFTFDKIYWNTNEITFQADGITVQSTVDEDGNVDSNMAGLIKIYCFNNGGSSPVVPVGYSNGSLAWAYGVFPGWTAQHTMDQLVFALVRIEYSKEKDITSLGELEFKITNSMTLPGDVLNDYMKNTRYGAGLTDNEVYSV